MPVPQPTADAAPRRLLRDVVFDKMLAAIHDGTLQPGERLNDDELVRWLGVSRTPIREAIAKLVDYGLVEMEANRYTRIATPTGRQYHEAFSVLFGFAELAARWAFPRFTDEDTDALDALLADVRTHAAASDRAVDDDVHALIGFLVDHADNALLTKLSASVLARARFVTVGSAEPVFAAAADAVASLRDAATDRDGEAGAAAVRALADGMADHLDAVRAADLATAEPEEAALVITSGPGI
ncbi:MULTISPECIES: GntR family transcriptional regulator [unclassified Curtobacterium]|uniref:GntR family transcriptional regulator n=1 Tax=unclassified Curtobacterium TaxID=257496 RepID=UPI000DA806F5|nr:MULTISPECIES: GntR family transcriptional regulator [unclassified Curtobacterium]PZE77725.1 GntR family transcriptional regulator [Curtobacterium sp. MCBD17_019]WIE54711.1 GntR family transcriptional regulator [Curtobacterium sp. MCBD17_003]